jgi:hypothetical protein
MYIVELRGDVEIGPKRFTTKSRAISYALVLIKKYIGTSMSVQVIIGKGYVIDRIITLGY